MYKKVGILGAGAVGAYIIWGLSKRKDVELYLIADGERKARLADKGLKINGSDYKPEVLSPAEANNKDLDLLVVSVKYNALPAAIEDIKNIVTDNTTILCPMNGVDSEELIAEAVGHDRIIYSLIKIASERVENEIEFNPETTVGLIYGEVDKKKTKDRVESLNSLWEGTGIRYRACDNIVPEIWAKFMLNVGNNLPQAVIGVGMGSYDDSQHMSYLREKMRAEVRAIAEAKGVSFEGMSEKQMLGAPAKPWAKFSTLQDIAAKRHSEIDMFSGAVVRMGQELGIPTPFNDYTYHAIKAIEEKNDGLFDYTVE